MIRKDNVDGRFFVKDLWLFILSLGDFEQEYLGKAHKYDQQKSAPNEHHNDVEKVLWLINYSNERLKECGINTNSTQY